MAEIRGSLIEGGGLEILTFLPGAKPMERMDMDEFLDALAKARVAQEQIRDLMAAAVRRALSKK